MLQHHHELPAEPHLSKTATTEAASDPLVEEYIDRLWSPTASARQAAHKLEAREEMRIHIESLIDANIELGDSHELAVEHAFEQFGNTQTIQREWKRASSTAPTMKAALATALVLNAAASLAAISTIALSDREGIYSCAPVFHTACCVLGIFVLPILAGICTRLLTKQRAMLATLYSLLLLLLPMTLLNSKLAQVIIHDGSPVNMGELARVHLLWIPLGCAGAGIVSLAKWLKNRPRRIVIAW